MLNHGFKEGDVVDYSGTLHFYLASSEDGCISVICPVNKVDIFGTDKDRMKALAINSLRVNTTHLTLNTSGRS